MSSSAPLLALLVVVAVAATASAGDRTPAVTPEPAPARAEEPSSAPSADGIAAASARQGFDMSWWSVDGGGDHSTGGDFALTAAIGQPESGATGTCSQALDGGLWSGVLSSVALFCDGFESGDTSAWSGS